jgi:hypothetical protein
MGSDVDRDGMFLEATVAESKPPRTVAEIFYSDASGKFFVSCFEEAVPMELIEYLIERGQRSLPPMKVGSDG